MTGGIFMTRKWTDIQSMERIILQMRQQGRTRQEIAKALNLDKEQIKNWIKRFNRKQAQPSVPLKRRGRPIFIIIQLLLEQIGWSVEEFCSGQAAGVNIEKARGRSFCS